VTVCGVLAVVAAVQAAAAVAAAPVLENSQGVSQSKIPLLLCLQHHVAPRQCAGGQQRLQLLLLLLLLTVMSVRLLLDSWLVECSEPCSLCWGPLPLQVPLLSLSVAEGNSSGGLQQHQGAEVRGSSTRCNAASAKLQKSSVDLELQLYDL